MGTVLPLERPYVEVWQEGKKLYGRTWMILSLAMNVYLISESIFNISNAYSHSTEEGGTIRPFISIGVLLSTLTCFPIHYKKYRWIQSLEYPHMSNSPLPEEIEHNRASYQCGPLMNEQVIQCYRDSFLGTFALPCQLRLMSGVLFTRALSQAITMIGGRELIFVDIIHRTDKLKRHWRSSLVPNRCTRINQRVISIGRTIWSAFSSCFQRCKRS